jgi:hypothetical protein
MSYTPPVGRLIQLQLSELHTPISGRYVQLSLGATAGIDAQYVSTAGFSTLELGGIFQAANRNRYIDAAGLSFYAAAEPVVFNWLTFVAPVGSFLSAFGTTFIRLQFRPLYPEAIPSRLNVSGYSVGAFDKRLQVIAADGLTARPDGIDSLGFGYPAVNNVSRVITLINCCCQADIGRPFVHH